MHQPPSELIIAVRARPDAEPVVWTLRCDPPGGDHPDPDAACAVLIAATRDPFAPVPPGAICAQIYGGPQQATITGRWRGRAVDARYRRTDACEIARWDAIRAVLGGSPSSAAEPGAEPGERR